MEKYKIFSQIDKLEEAYLKPTQRVVGLLRNPVDVIKAVEYYSSDNYLSGKFDELGKEKPFYNVGNYRVTVAKIATDLDVKDIKFEPDSLKDSTQAMLYNHELFKYLKESNFSETLNEMGDTRPRYGGLLVKKYENEDGEMEIEVIDWTNVHFDPSDIMGSPIIEDHYLHPSDLIKREGSWENIDEVIKQHAKETKDKPEKILIKEVTGEFQESYDPEVEDNDENNRKFKTMCFYVACINKKKYFLYKEDIKNIKDKYRYLAWRKYGLGLGIGVWEDSFEGQAWVNDTVISIKRSMDISTKVIGKTTSKKVGGSLIKGIDHGHIFEMEEGRTLDFGPLGATALPQFQTVIDLWNTQMDKGTSTYDANTGEAPTSGTPYSQTALLNQVANSPFEYQREVWGIFLNQILNDWIKPYLKKRIKKEHYLVSEFNNEELDLIDNSIANFDTNRKIIDAVLNQRDISPEDQTRMTEGIKESLRSKGNKREINIPKDWLDVEGKITANITGELKNKGVILQSLDSIFKTVVATFNPQTGEYSALTDPVLSKIFGQIIEMSGVPLSSAQLKSNTKAVPTASPMDVSNIAPVEATM